MTRIGRSSRQSPRSTLLPINWPLPTNRYKKGDHNDAGLDAEIHSTLENLSEYADITATQQSDGSWQVLLGEQTPLVVGSQAYAIGISVSTPAGVPATVAGGNPHTRILDFQGGEVTAHISDGKLAGLLNVRN